MEKHNDDDDLRRREQPLPYGAAIGSAALEASARVAHVHVLVLGCGRTVSVTKDKTESWLIHMLTRHTTQTESRSH